MNFANSLKYRIKKNKNQYINIFTKVLNTGMFLNGKFTKKLEKNLATFLSAKYCLTCANGTDALEIVFKSFGLKENDKVFIAANAGMYSATSLNSLNILPRYFDVCMDNYGPTIDIIKSLKIIPKAIVITHLYGRINKDISLISRYCKQNKILLIEDCAQAIGTCLDEKKAGTFGDAATFSFFPTKNLFGFGDGGAIIFKSRNHFVKAKMIKQYGWSKKYYVTTECGQNSRMDEINAAIINFNLLSLECDNLKRFRIALTYSSMIKNSQITVPKIILNNQCNYHLFVIFVKKNRKKLIKYLEKKKIFTQIHYPIPDHRQKINLKKFANLNLPNSEKMAKQIISLPCYPDLKIKNVIKISKIINLWKS